MGFETPKAQEIQNTPKSTEELKPEGKPAVIIQKTRERVVTFLASNQLKLREYFGKIDGSQLQSLLKLEFEQAKKDTLPISDIFDPEAELLNLRTLSREQKREALAEFKNKLARQREAWATCRTFLKRKIEVNHDIDKKDLTDWIGKFSGEYSFTDTQRQTTKEIINDYYANRQRAKEIREQYPDDVDLVNELSGQTFDKDTKFKISIGPMSINIYCDSFNAGRLLTGNSTPQKTKCIAFACGSNHIPQILYNVFNTSTLQHKLSGSATLQHENQHQENKLFRQQFDKYDNNPRILWSQYKNEQDVDTKKTLLESYLRSKRDEALIRAKDEIIAMKKDRELYKYDIWFKQDNSSYDYLSVIRDTKDSDLYKEYSQRILVEEYRRIIKDAITAFDQLKKKGRYSIDQTISLLTDKSLTQWPKTTRRLLEEKQ